MFLIPACASNVHVSQTYMCFVSACGSYLHVSHTCRYGDVYPLTDMGKLLAVAYMPLSLGVFSGLLAAFAKGTFRLLILSTCDLEGRGIVRGGFRLRGRRGDRIVRGAAQVGSPPQRGAAGGGEESVHTRERKRDWPLFPPSSAYGSKSKETKGREKGTQVGLAPP